jgi:hypothetical protein
VWPVHLRAQRAGALALRHQRELRRRVAAHLVVEPVAQHHVHRAPPTHLEAGLQQGASHATRVSKGSLKCNRGLKRVLQINRGGPWCCLVNAPPPPRGRRNGSRVGSTHHPRHGQRRGVHAARVVIRLGRLARHGEAARELSPLRLRAGAGLRRRHHQRPAARQCQLVVTLRAAFPPVRGHARLVPGPPQRRAHLWGFRQGFISLLKFNRGFIACAPHHHACEA